MRRRIAFALAAVLPVACLFPSLGDLEGDAGGDAQSPDVTIDSIVADAQPDVIVKEASGPFCSSIDARLCEDFDEHPFAQQFTGSDFSATTDAGADDAAFTSPPLSFFAHLAGVGSGHVAYMARVFSQTATVADYSVSVRVDQWVTGGASAVLGGITIDDGAPNQHVLTFYVTDGYTALEEVFANDAGNQYLDHKLTTPLMLGQWGRLHVHLDLGNNDVLGDLERRFGPRSRCDRSELAVVRRSARGHRHQLRRCRDLAVDGSV